MELHSIEMHSQTITDLFANPTGLVIVIAALSTAIVNIIVALRTNRSVATANDKLDTAAQEIADHRVDENNKNDAIVNKLHTVAAATDVIKDATNGKSITSEATIKELQDKIESMHAVILQLTINKTNNAN